MVIYAALTAVSLLGAGFFAGVAWAERKAGREWLDTTSLAIFCGMFAALFGYLLALAID